MADKGTQGLGSLKHSDPARAREIAALGGRAAHKKGTAHEWTSAEAQAAGRKGGTASGAARKARAARESA